MPRKLHISVPAPCTQKWDEMSFVDEQQRHCLSCNKFIFDFTKMSDAELVAYFNRNTVSCGRFAPHQLNKVIQPPENRRTFWLPVLTLQTLLAMSDSSAQQVKPAADIHVADSSNLNVKVPLRDVIHTLRDTLIATGRVLGIDDSLQEPPLAAATIVFNNDSDRVTCTTDEQGNFKIKLPHRNVGDTVMIEIRAAGYVPYFTSIVLSEPQEQPILRISPNQIKTLGVMGGAVVTHTPASRTSYFFGWVFHPRSWWWW